MHLSELEWCGYRTDDLTFDRYRCQLPATVMFCSSTTFSMPPPSSKCLPLSNLSDALKLLILCLVCSISQAAHSRRRNVVLRESSPRYDRTITTFSSNGRLLQVEYGMEASFRGEMIAAMLHPDGIVLVVGSPAAGKVHRIDAHIYMITAGLAPDGRALASALRNACQNFRMEYGEAPTIREVAIIAARMQHDLTKTGGARPLGCTAIIVGVDPTSADTAGDNHGNHSLPGQPRIFQTDPGGIMEECFYCAAGKGRSQVMKELGEFHSRIRRKKLHESARDMAMSVIGVLEKSSVESPKSISVLTIRPHQRHRGGAATLWIDHVNRQNVKRLQSILEKL